MEIITTTLSEAHEAAIDAVLNTSKAIEIQTHADKAEKTIEFEAEDGSDEIIVIKVLEPLKEPQVSKGAMFKEGFTAAYKKQFLTLTPPRADGKHATYTYWNRLADYPYSGIDPCGDFNEFEHGNGKGNGYNQVDELIGKIASDPNSRRGVMITWKPEFDSESLEPPCMNWVQFVIRKGKVNMRCIFRSQDILSGLGENLVGCAAMLEYVTKEINVRIFGSTIPYEVGSLILISTIPHIYHIRDAHELQMMKTEINRKKTFGLWNPIVK
jgi:thymidylate synthase